MLPWHTVRVLRAQLQTAIDERDTANELLQLKRQEDLEIRAALFTHFTGPKEDADD